jgi:hypothetical protein
LTITGCGPWERLVAKTFANVDLVEAVCGLRQPHQHGQLAAIPTCHGHIAKHSPEDQAELA